MSKVSLLLLIALALASVTLPARAYLDPASGSMMLQLILGGIAGAALAVKLFWHRLLGFFGAESKGDDEESPV